ncbi:MAG: hypothetical protein AcusKO_43180 [Acuticoccus sp.]
MPFCPTSPSITPSSACSFRDPTKYLVQSRLRFGIDAHAANREQRLQTFKSRWRYGLLDLCAGRHHWPTFNLVDVPIVAGVAILLLNNPRKPKDAFGEAMTKAASG